MWPSACKSISNCMQTLHRANAKLPLKVAQNYHDRWDFLHKLGQLFLTTRQTDGNCLGRSQKDSEPSTAAACAHRKGYRRLKAATGARATDLRGLHHGQHGKRLTQHGRRVDSQHVSQERGIDRPKICGEPQVAVVKVGEAWWVAIEATVDLGPDYEH